jgi:hypothetical protein
VTARFAFLLLLLSVVRVSANTFVVSNTNDNGPGSLRQAIIDANGHSNSGVVDAISFNIAGTGVHTVTLASALPDITEGLLLNGWSQPGFQGGPLIELKAGTGVAADGLRITGDFSAVRGLIVNGFQTGIYVSGSLNDIQGCYIGTEASGTQAAPNDRGILFAGAFRNLVGGGDARQRNVISGNREAGISFVHRLVQSTDLAPDQNMVVGNFIGTDKAGAGALPNGGDGVLFSSSGGFSSGPAFRNRVGGTTFGARNVISGNLGNGIQMI